MSNLSKVGAASDAMTRFERAIVFRVARGYFFFMAVVAVVTFVGGAIVGARGLSKQELTPPAPVPAPSARPPVNLEAIMADLDRQKQQAAQASSTIDVTPAKGPQPRATDPEVDRFNRAVAALRALFPDPPYSWENELERTCSVPTSFGCLQWGTRIKRYGVAGAVSKVLEGMDREEIIEYLGIVTELLKRAPVEKRLELVGPIIAAEKDSRSAYESVLAKRKRRVEEQQSKYELDVTLNNAKHTEWRQMGLYGIGLGFSLLIVVSLFLAFLSMERHTRALEQLVKSTVPGQPARIADTSDLT